jgi:bifunctional non-homologous end joining protein LigD
MWRSISSAAGEKLLTAMCRSGQEGIIAKRADAPYRGDRTRNWVKVKCTLRQEFVVMGWTKSPARARAFGALLLGQMEKGKLVYKGKVGTGFDTQMLMELAETMAPLAQSKPPAEVAGQRRAAPSGSNRSWWPKSPLPSSPAMAACGMPVSWACVRTRRRRM